MKIDEIYKLKRLAGIIDREGKQIQSTDESNISITGSAKKKIEREKNIQPELKNGLNYGLVDRI